VSPLLIVTLMGAFLAVALLSGAAAFVVLERQAPGRKRFQALAAESRNASATPASSNPLADRASPGIERIASFVPKSPAEMGRLRRRLVKAGYHSLTAAVVFSLAELILPVLFALPLLVFVAWPLGLVCAALGGIAGFLVPSFALARLVQKRRQAIGNGLPDVLDLLIVCLEAGSSLDQAMIKATTELHLVHPALSDELKMLVAETRAGKPRIEAFKNLEARTTNDDVRALVAMLVQTDRFGTSISLALRTFAEVARTKRRQSAEERAAKIGVKMVFPLVLLLFPALYVVILGPAVVQIVHVFFDQAVN
jgi:tight adherence protein C